MTETPYERLIQALIADALNAETPDEIDVVYSKASWIGEDFDNACERVDTLSSVIANVDAIAGALDEMIGVTSDARLLAQYVVEVMQKAAAQEP